MKGMIFDVKKFAIHDGPGIRSTVFFKGCPLHCRWCHNPEGIAPGPEVMVNGRRCLAGCSECLSLCPQHALVKIKNVIKIDRKRCDRCGICAQACPAEALQMAGRAVSVEALTAELAKDEPFFQDSQGGVTFSGGEPLAQPEFLHAMLRACKERGWHTAVDTSGYAPFTSFAGILSLVDLFLFDLKIMSEDKHRVGTGESNQLILENLTKLSAQSRSLAIRVPVIPGFNDSAAAMNRLADFCLSLPKQHPLHLLPYHRGGDGKWQRLGQVNPLPDTRPPAASALKKIIELFEQRKIPVVIGG